MPEYWRNIKKWTHLQSAHRISIRKSIFPPEYSAYTVSSFMSIAIRQALFFFWGGKSIIRLLRPLSFPIRPLSMSISSCDPKLWITIYSRRLNVRKEVKEKGYTAYRCWVAFSFHLPQIFNFLKWKMFSVQIRTSCRPSLSAYNENFIWVYSVP